MGAWFGMAEYKKEIGTAVAFAILVAAFMGAIAIYSFPSSAGNLSNGSSTTTQSTSSTTSTIPFPKTYTNETILMDPRLAVTRMNGLLGTSNNATRIAETLALYLNESPVQMVEYRPATCSSSETNCRLIDYPYSTAFDYYVFKTAKGSNITVDFVQGTFLELQYVVQNYRNICNGC